MLKFYLHRRCKSTRAKTHAATHSATDGLGALQALTRKLINQYQHSEFPTITRPSGYKIISPAPEA
ncbi:MAG: hypothetical protein CMJ19_17320 [Phycisphaeraceae bacterium]|nr:hypothetical protein [Phycisphaeraceae bacterium]